MYQRNKLKSDDIIFEMDLGISLVFADQDERMPQRLSSRSNIRNVVNDSNATNKLSLMNRRQFVSFSCYALL